MRCLRVLRPLIMRSVRRSLLASPLWLCTLRVFPLILTLLRVTRTPCLTLLSRVLTSRLLLFIRPVASRYLVCLMPRFVFCRVCVLPVEDRKLDDALVCRIRVCSRFPLSLFCSRCFTRSRSG